MKGVCSLLQTEFCGSEHDAGTASGGWGLGHAALLASPSKNMPVTRSHSYFVP